MGIIHHGTYPAYLEEARAAMLRDAGFPYEEVRAGDGRASTSPCWSSTSATAAPCGSTTWWPSTCVVDDLTRTTFQVGYLVDVEGRGPGHRRHRARGGRRAGSPVADAGVPGRR